MNARLKGPWWNWIFFAVGMAGVWLVTHSFQALLFAWIASLHMDINVIPADKWEAQK